MLNIPEYDIETITTNNSSKFADIFYSNDRYYSLVEGRCVTDDVILGTVNYCPKGFEKDNVKIIGISKNGVPVALLSHLEHYPKNGISWLGLLLVHKNNQGQGVGTKIVEALVKWAAEHGFYAMQLSVQDNNLSAVEFWQDVGFSIIDKTPGVVAGVEFMNLTMERGLHI